MEVKVIGTSNLNYQASKRELDLSGGKSAGICYSKNPFEHLLNESEETTEKRIERTKNGGHDSVYGHSEINLIIEGAPKALAMYLNNEHEYNTSERSARYTKMSLTGEEQALYDEWVEIFKNKIISKYQQKAPDFINERKINSLAQENARYLISVFTPTTMEYSTSYRQLNYIYGFMQKELRRENPTEFDRLMRPYFKEFCEGLEKTGYIDERLSDDKKGREFTLIDRSPYPTQEHFGDVYSTSYQGSFAQLAQAQRHRTIYYSFKFENKDNYFIPPMIKDDYKLVEKWLSDCNKQRGVFPQGLLLNIQEKGTYENFILKMQERLCSCAQLEINLQTKSTLLKYIKALKLSGHPRATELEQFSKGSRCTFPGKYKFDCKSRCNFSDGIIGEREI